MKTSHSKTTSKRNFPAHMFVMLVRIGWLFLSPGRKRLLTVGRATVRPATVVLVVGTILTAVPGCNSTDTPEIVGLGGTPMIDEQFQAADLGTVGKEWSVPTDGSEPTVVIADVVGDAVQEILLAGAEGVQLFEPDGTALTRFDLPFEAARLALTADVNRDGKEDLVFGALEAGTSHVAVTTGKGELLVGGSGGDLEAARTDPWFYRDGRVYFTAVQKAWTPPRVVGYLDTQSGDTHWLLDRMAVPRKLLFSPETELIGLSTRASRPAMPGEETGEEFKPNINALGVLDLDGETVSYVPVGLPVQEATRLPDQVSSTFVRVADVVHDESPEMVGVINHATLFDGGNSEVQVRTLNGELLYRYVGPEETTGSLGVYRTGEAASSRAGAGSGHAGDDSGGEPYIIVVWNRTGTVEHLSASLEPVHTRQLPGTVHNAVLGPAGDVNGDGREEYLVHDMDRWFILDRSLQVLFGGRAEGPVRSVHAVRDESGKVMFVVLADSLTVYTVGHDPAGTVTVTTDPPGLPVDVVSESSGDLIAEKHPAGRRLELPPGSYRILPAGIRHETEDAGGTVSGSITVQAGGLYCLHVKSHGDLPASEQARPTQDQAPQGELRAQSTPRDRPMEGFTFRVLAETPLPEGATFARVGDYVGDERYDVILAFDGWRSWQVYSKDLALLAETHNPFGGVKTNAQHDLDGDGKLDFVAISLGDPMEVYGTRSDGRGLFRVAFAHTYYSSLRFLGTHGGPVVSVTTGHMLYPRGVFALNREDWSLRYFHRTAGFVSQAVPIGDRLYLYNYTPENGAEVVLPDGQVDRDGQMFVHIIDTDGNLDPRSRPFPSDMPRGMIKFFSSDSDGDGQAEPFIGLHRDERYNPGPSGVFRLHENGELTQVIEGPENGNVEIFAVEVAGKPVLILKWDISSGSYYLYNQDFELQSHIEIEDREDRRTIRFRDFGGDGRLEVISLRDGEMILERADGTQLASYTMKGQAIRYYDHWVDRLDGTETFAITGEKTLQVVTIETR